MLNLISKLLVMPVSALLIMAAGTGAVAFALTAQYGFGILPCELCLWQRVPFIGGSLLALIAIALQPYGLHTRALLGVIAALYFANFGIAIFHTGVERHWWEWHSSCTGGALDSLSVEALRHQLLGTPVVRCDEISWSLFGLSMANYNIPFSLGVALFSALGATFKPKA